MLEILLISFAIICIISGVVGCIIPALPGPPLCYIGLLILYFGNILEISTTEIIIWGIITTFVTIIDFFLTPYITKKFGGSKAGNRGAIAGLIIGIFVPWPIGQLLCPFIGAFISELIFSKRNSTDSIKSAFGAFLSFLIGTGIKLLVCIVLVINISFKLF